MRMPAGPEHSATVTLPPGSPDLLCMTELVTSSLTRSTAVSVAGCSSPRSWRAISRAAPTDCGVPGSTRSTGARTGAGARQVRHAADLPAGGRHVSSRLAITGRACQGRQKVMSMLRLSGQTQVRVKGQNMGHLR